MYAMNRHITDPRHEILSRLMSFRRLFLCRFSSTNFAAADSKWYGPDTEYGCLTNLFRYSSEESFSIR